jgi:mxaJ protein
MEVKTQQFGKAKSVAIAATCAFLISPALAASAAAEPADNKSSPLRICAAAKEAPYSSRDGKGFENRIAAALGESMGRKIDFVWTERPAIYLVRDELNKGNCDVVIGVDTGDERVLSTKPYYRAPYVFVERADSPLEITSWDSPDLEKANNVGYSPGGPAEVMMVKNGLFNKNFNYVKSLTNFKSPRNQYVRIDPERMIGDVASGKSDLVVAFAPEVARYVKATDGKLKMIVVPDNNERVDGEKVPFHFDQSMGVRKDDQKLLDQLNAALEAARPQIHDILKDEGIPLDEPTATDTKS